uniref:P-type ATPase n=1 Tax=Romanomermis culicivorax TaxID=13658 RepID=A0A915JPN3_ROMCU
MNPLVQTMACCHSLTRIDNVLTGDPLDLVLFRETGWILEEPEVLEESDRYDMLAPTIVRPQHLQDEKLIFPSSLPAGDHSAPANLDSFQSANEDRMSVVVRIFGSQKLTLYCKGAPETVVGLCLPETVPFEFADILQRYTQKGYRVLAAASRSLNMSYVKAQRASRDLLERDLTFRGLIILENRLKPETTPVISQLSRADVRSIMVTGDNILTAVSVGRECGILHENKRLYVVEICDEVIFDAKTAEEPSPPVIKIKRDKFCSTISASSVPQLERLNNGSKEFEGERQRRRSTSSRRNTDESLFIKCEDGFKLRYQLAITGASFALLVKHYPHLVPQLVSVCDIFARMSPEQKALLVNDLQELGYVVAMCGDGANDCGALK